MSPHGFDKPGDGYPACTVPGCGRGPADPVHTRGRMVTRLVLVVEHAVAPRAELELALLEALGSDPALTILGSTVLP